MYSRFVFVKTLVYFLLLVFSLFTFNISSQNLLPNSSFENYKQCPIGYGGGEINKLESWYDIYHSADYYNCSIGVPNNLFGYQYPKTGSGYVGIASGESIGVKMEYSLEAGKNYLVEFYVSRADSQGEAIKEIGVHLSKDSICSYSSPESILQVENTDSVINDIVGWTKISGIYNATGCENYIALIVGGSNSYYYFDDISITCADSTGCSLKYCNYQDSLIVPNVFTPNNDSKNDWFYVKFTHDEPSDFICVIYNRWGKVVSEINYPLFYWDGTNFDGDNVSEGVYYYLLSSTYSNCGVWFHRDGFVHLKR